MPDSQYTFKVILDAADAEATAKLVRQTIERELGKLKAVDVGGIGEATKSMEELKKVASQVGRALTKGIRDQTDKTRQYIQALHDEINQVVRAGASPVQEALDAIGREGTGAIGLIEGATGEASKKMVEYQTKIGTARAQIDKLQEDIAELGAMPYQPLGGGPIKSLLDLFREVESPHRRRQVKQLIQDMERDLKPLREEVSRLQAAAKDEAAPAIDKLTEELAELQARSREVAAAKPIRPEAIGEMGAYLERVRAWEQELSAVNKAILETSRQLEQLKQIQWTGDAEERVSELTRKQREYLQQLERLTPFYRELTAQAGTMEAVRMVDPKAAAALAEMLAKSEAVRRSVTDIKRGITSMERLKDKIELPESAEGSLADLVIAERQLGIDTKLAAEAIVEQQKALRRLVPKLDEARLAAEGLDKVQREAARRAQAAGLRELRAGTKGKPTLEQVQAVSQQVIADVHRMTEEIARSTGQVAAKDEATGIMAWLRRVVGRAQETSEQVVGHSIIPEMVNAINRWLADIGKESPFAGLTLQAETAAERIGTAMRDAVKGMGTEELAGQVNMLKSAVSDIETELQRAMVRTSTASREYRQAWNDYEAEVRRVRGDDPTAMALLAQGKTLKGTGLRGEFKTMQIIDEGVTRLSMKVEERKRFSREEQEHLEELEARRYGLLQLSLAAVTANDPTPRVLKGYLIRLTLKGDKRLQPTTRLRGY